MVARVLSREIPTMAPQVQGAREEELVEIVQGEGETKEEVEVGTEGETLLIINSSNKAIDLVSCVCVCVDTHVCIVVLLIYVYVVLYL